MRNNISKKFKKNVTYIREQNNGIIHTLADLGQILKNSTLIRILDTSEIGYFNRNIEYKTKYFFLNKI